MPKYVMLNAYQLLISVMSVKNILVLDKDNLPICLLLCSSVDFNIWENSPPKYTRSCASGNTRFGKMAKLPS